MNSQLSGTPLKPWGGRGVFLTRHRAFLCPTLCAATHTFYYPLFIPIVPHSGTVALTQEQNLPLSNGARANRCRLYDFYCVQSKNNNTVLKCSSLKGFRSICIDWEILGILIYQPVVTKKPVQTKPCCFGCTATRVSQVPPYIFSLRLQPSLTPWQHRCRNQYWQEPALKRNEVQFQEELDE